MKVPVFYKNHKVLVTGCFNHGNCFQVDFGYFDNGKENILFSHVVDTLEDFYKIAPSFRVLVLYSNPINEEEYFS